MPLRTKYLQIQSQGEDSSGTRRIMRQRQMWDPWDKRPIRIARGKSNDNWYHDVFYRQLALCNPSVKYWYLPKQRAWYTCGPISPRSSQRQSRNGSSAIFIVSSTNIEICPLGDWACTRDATCIGLEEVRLVERSSVFYAAQDNEEHKDYWSSKENPREETQTTAWEEY